MACFRKESALAALVCILIAILLCDQLFSRYAASLIVSLDAEATPKVIDVNNNCTTKLTLQDVSLLSEGASVPIVSNEQPKDVNRPTTRVERSQDNQAQEDDPTKDLSSLNRKNWFEYSQWTEECIHVEHVCHSMARWWYKKPVITKSANQPNLTFVAHNSAVSLEIERLKLNYPRTLRIEPESEVFKNMACPYSPVPNHLVLFSRYDHMLGEFYVRVIIGLNRLLENQENFQAMMESTQFYLQVHGFGSLLDSHHAFAAPFLSHRLLDFKDLMRSPTCSCLERLVFCGYVFKWDKNKTEVEIDAGDGINPGRNLVPKFSRLASHPDLFRSARNKVRQTMILDNALVQQNIESFRRKFLKSRGVHDSFEDWKIVGLAQRTTRRRWENIAEVQETCDLTFRSKKILCMIVNVEDEEYHPTHHVVVHGSLDALIGIHGAQLTDALWMKPGAVVVEMLVFLLAEESFGNWTRTVTKATPLGVIYTGTDLYHVGLPLQSGSVTKCKGKEGEDAVTCLRKPRWDVADFSANKTDIMDLIDGFVDDRPATCDDQKALSGDYRFVLYNVQCDDGTGMKNQQFFWDRELASIDKFAGVHP